MKTRLRIDAGGFVTEVYNLALKDKAFSVYGYALHPYPETADAITEKDYTLELVYQPNQKIYMQNSL